MPRDRRQRYRVNLALETRTIRALARSQSHSSRLRSEYPISKLANKIAASKPDHVATLDGYQGNSKQYKYFLERKASGGAECDAKAADCQKRHQHSDTKV